TRPDWVVVRISALNLMGVGPHSLSRWGVTQTRILPLKEAPNVVTRKEVVGGGILKRMRPSCNVGDIANAL
ncbi:unnamed protein product, partial [Sphenostylis stenocarpa]